jgi:hypothetical protein
MTDTTPAQDTPPNTSKRASDWSWPRFIRNAVLIAGVIGLGTWYGVEGVYPNLVPKNFGVVEDGVLYRAGRLTPAATRNVVEAHGIRTIIDFGGWDKHPKGDARAQATAEALGVDRIVLPLYGDATGDPNRYVVALEIMNDPDRQPVLVHCAAGSERTGCAIGLFRMIHDDVDTDEVIAYSREFRHDPEKNPRLRTTLDTWGDAILEAVRTNERIAYDGTSPDVAVRGLPDDLARRATAPKPDAGTTEDEQP